MEILSVAVITVFMLFWFVCACRATIRQSSKEQITTWADVNAEMRAVIWLLAKKLIRRFTAS